MRSPTYHYVPERSLLKFIMAGALGSMLGTLLLESIRGKKPIVGWIVLAVLVITYSLYAHHPLTTRQLEAMIASKEDLPPSTPTST
jgi:hypothetical protein